MRFAAQQHVKQDRNSLNSHPFSMSWAGLSCIFFHAHFNSTIFSIKKWCKYKNIFFLNLFPSILLHFQVRAAKRNVMFSTREKWHWRISSSCPQRADRHFSDLRVRERMKDSVWCFKIPDFTWLKHFYLEDHDQSLLNVGIRAQFSMSVVVSSMEPVCLASSQ